MVECSCFVSKISTTNGQVASFGSNIGCRTSWDFDFRIHILIPCLRTGSTTAQRWSCDASTNGTAENDGQDRVMGFSSWYQEV